MNAGRREEITLARQDSNGVLPDADDGYWDVNGPTPPHYHPAGRF